MVRSDPFQLFKLETHGNEIDIPALHSQLFNLVFYFQKLSLRHIANANPLKKSQLASVFKQQILNSTMRPVTKEKLDHFALLETLTDADHHHED